MCPSSDVTSWPAIILSRPSTTGPDAGRVTATWSSLLSASISDNRGQLRAINLLVKEKLPKETFVGHGYGYRYGYGYR